MFILHIDLEMFVVLATKTKAFLNVLVVFPKVEEEGANVKNLEQNTFGSTKLATCMDVAMFLPSKLGNWLSLNVELNVASFDYLLGESLNTDMIVLNLHCGQFDIVGSPYRSSYCQHRCDQ